MNLVFTKKLLWASALYTALSLIILRIKHTFKSLVKKHKQINDMMNSKTPPPFRLAMDPNKLDSKIKSFEYNGNHYLYICHLNIYSKKDAGHIDDRPDQVKYLIKSFYGKYLDAIAPFEEFDTDKFYEKLTEAIDAHLISTEGSY